MEYFIMAYINKNGVKYKLTKNGKGMTDTVNLYLNGVKAGTFASVKQAKVMGQNATDRAKP